MPTILKCNSGKLNVVNYDNKIIKIHSISSELPSYILQASITWDMYEESPGVFKPRNNKPKENRAFPFEYYILIIGTDNNFAKFIKELTGDEPDIGQQWISFDGIHIQIDEETGVICCKNTEI